MTKEFNFYKNGLLILLIGLVQFGWYFMEVFFIDHYVDLGIREWFWPFVGSLIILLAGLLILKKRPFGIILLPYYIIAILLDRITVLLFFWAHTYFEEIIFPLVFALPLLWILKRSKTKFSFSWQNLCFVVGFILLAILSKIIL